MRQALLISLCSVSLLVACTPAKDFDVEAALAASSKTLKVGEEVTLTVTVDAKHFESRVDAKPDWDYAYFYSDDNYAAPYLGYQDGVARLEDYPFDPAVEAVGGKRYSQAQKVGSQMIGELKVRGIQPGEAVIKAGFVYTEDPEGTMASTTPINVLNHGVVTLEVTP